MKYGVLWFQHIMSALAKENHGQQYREAKKTKRETKQEQWIRARNYTEKGV